MSDLRFGDVMAQERARLNAERDEILAQQRELESKLDAINREFAAVQAYENAKSGKAATPRASGRQARLPRQGSRREAVLALIGENPEGIARKDILEKLGLKGDKAGEMSVSNVLTSLIKGQRLDRQGGRYRLMA